MERKGMNVHLSEGLGRERRTKGLLSSPWGVVSLMACLGLVSIIDRIALSLLIEPLKTDLQITDTQAGLLLGPTFAIIYTLSAIPIRSEEHTSELQSLMRNSYAVFCLKKKKKITEQLNTITHTAS